MSVLVAMNDIHPILEDLYLSASKPSSLGGISRLWKEARKKIPGIKKEEVKEFLQTQYAYTRHKPARKKFKKRGVIAVNINDVYQMDLVDLQKFAQFNDGVKYLLTAIDCLSRYAFAIPLTSKKPKDVVEALSKIFKEYGIPLKVFTDKGREFLNKDVKVFLEELGIQQWSSNNPGKAVVVERFNRTLKDRLWVHMSDQNNYRYIDVLDDVVKGYNATVHSITGLAPVDVGEEHVSGLLAAKRTIPIANREFAFKVGDRVRVSTNKLKFEKGYEANYSELIFKIVESRTSNHHHLYRIADLADKVEPGWFYEQELSKVSLNDREKYRISRIVRERKVNGRKQYLVNWVGYPSVFDSWEYADELE